MRTLENFTNFVIVAKVQQKWPMTKKWSHEMTTLASATRSMHSSPVWKSSSCHANRVRLKLWVWEFQIRSWALSSSSSPSSSSMRSIHSWRAKTKNLTHQTLPDPTETCGSEHAEATKWQTQANQKLAFCRHSQETLVCAFHLASAL